jgi:hypothetical protein
LHSAIIPIAFVENYALTENLDISNLNLNIKSDVHEQKRIPRDTFVKCSCNQKIMNLSWWVYRDYDKLWETFHPEDQDVGKL